MKYKSLPYLAIIIAVCFTITRGKMETAAFSTIKIGMNYLQNVNRTIFHNYWDPKSGCDLFMEFPFYFGTIKTGLHLFSYKSRESGVPGFRTYFYYIGWGLEVPLIKILKSYWGFSIGSHQMTFDDKEINETQVTESELSSSFDAGLRFKIRRQTYLHLGSNYLIIYTHKRIELFFISFGIATLFKTPGWLRKFLE